MYNQVENYMTNVNEVMDLVHKYEHLFKKRDGAKRFFFATDSYTRFSENSDTSLNLKKIQYM